MERPLCPICETKHFARESHVFEDEVKPLHEVLRVKQRANGEMPLDQSVLPVAVKVVGGPERRPKKDGGAKFDRAAYQREYMREYMRKRRAK